MGDQTAEPAPSEDPHRLSDARELRALAHPVRVALYQVLTVHESLTATQASKLVGGSPSSVSYHLRTLAKYGYVQETDDGTGRERPWKLSRLGFRWNTVIFGTPDELRELQDAIGRLTAGFRARITDPSLRPEGSRTFEFQLYTHPIDTGEIDSSD